MEKRPLTLTEYNRVHQIICGVLSKVTVPEKACIFFASVGSYLLNKHYGIPARPVAGGFAICINDHPKIACFGKVGDKIVTTATDGFHMWIQTKTHLIDFMAPLFPEAFAEMLPTTQIPRKMFQQPIASEAANLDSLNHMGDFYTFPNVELTEQLSAEFLERQLNIDLLKVVEAWFGSPGGKLSPTFAMHNDLGKVEHLSLPPSAAVSAW